MQSLVDSKDKTKTKEEFLTPEKKEGKDVAVKSPEPLNT
jgi:hypothetical protein